MNSLKIKKIYNCVLSQVFSTSGQFLFVGNRFGDIFVLDIQKLEQTNLTNKPAEDADVDMKTFPQGQGRDINSLCFHNNFLIIGTIGNFYGLKWHEEQRHLSSKPHWEVRIPMDADATEVPDVNYMWIRPETNTLYAGCGDNVVYQISLEDGRVVRDYRGHSDFIHSVSGCGVNTIVSGSEDGTVCLWNENEKLSTGKIIPAENTELKRPEFGNWIGAVDANNDWVICGGGPRCAIWHLRSMNTTGSYSFPGKVHLCYFVKDKVLIGGEHYQVQFYQWNGNEEASVTVENIASYTAVWHSNPYKFMSVAGFSNKLHIVKDFLLDCKIDLYGNVKEEQSTKDEFAF
ncbi:THO complex subunit 6 [Teleopsis dalmanni]|uniref:THO complex subunit 6 n=1 Tax=Teleopsis dalmanni TaxID=139649 RepID=UPI0018CCE5E0|nr:THO complex subunit 6 [Teleopsis dalmanni]